MLVCCVFGLCCGLVIVVAWLRLLRLLLARLTPLVDPGSCVDFGTGVAWLPGAVGPSPAAKARKQVVTINQGGQGLGNPKFSQNIMLGIYNQFLSMS